MGLARCLNSVTAYRCEDYSLLDILNDRVVAKKHDADFPPPTDLLVAVLRDVMKIVSAAQREEKRAELNTKA